MGPGPLSHGSPPSLVQDAGHSRHHLEMSVGPSDAYFLLRFMRH